MASTVRAQVVMEDARSQAMGSPNPEMMESRKAWSSSYYSSYQSKNNHESSGFTPHWKIHWRKSHRKSFARTCKLVVASISQTLHGIKHKYILCIQVISTSRVSVVEGIVENPSGNSTHNNKHAEIQQKEKPRQWLHHSQRHYNYNTMYLYSTNYNYWPNGD